MIKAKSSDIAKILSAKLYNGDSKFEGISIDSRTISTNNLFIAIPGKNHDGHDYIDKAIQKGASVIICQRPIEITSTIPYIIVKNTLKALNSIAVYYRQEFINTHTIAITGTNGKTSVTKLTSEILSKSVTVASTIGNYNNEIGLPLSILNSPMSSKVNVFELGASNKNDIHHLTNICSPNMTALLNISPAHIDSFGSFKVLKETKEEIFKHPNISQVVLNLDDCNYEDWRKMNHDKKITTVSLYNDSANYHISSETDKQLFISTPKGDCCIDKTLTRNLLLINIIFSIALSVESGAEIDSIPNVIENFSGVEGRFYKFRSKYGYDVFDDSYNANPESMKLAINKISTYEKDKIFVMGDMGELGIESRDHHLSIMEHAKQMDIKYLFYMGDYKEEARTIFGDNCYTYNEMDELIGNLINIANENSLVLVKASRFMKFDIIVNSLR